MYKLTGLLMAVTILCSYNSTKVNSMKTLENALSEKERNDGWVTLFDGKTTNGWHSYGKEKAGSDWKVTDGAIMLEAAKEEKKKMEVILLLTTNIQTLILKQIGKFHLRETAV